MERSAKWALECLVPQSKLDGSRRRKKLGWVIPLADAVVFEQDAAQKTRRRAAHWVFNGEDGRICAKDGGALSWSKVRERFLRMANQQNEEAPVCAVYMTNGTTQKLDRTTFMALVAGAKRDGGLSSVEILQAWVGGTHGEEQVRCRTCYSKEYGSETTVLSGKTGSMVELENVLEESTRDLVQALEKASKTQIFSIDIQFAQDQDGVFRIGDLSNIMSSAAKGETIPNSEFKDAGDAREDSNEAKPHRMPKQGKRGRGSGGSKNGLRTASASELPTLKSTGTTPKGKSRNSLSTDHTRIASRCRGDFCGLLVSCTDDPLSVLDLSNLTENKDRTLIASNETTWAKELEKVRATSSSQLVRKRKLLASSNGQKSRGKLTRTASASSVAQETLQDIEQKDILLARNEMHFITGAIRQTDSALREDQDFAHAWKELDSRLQNELGLKYSDEFYQETTVCSDCYNVYRKLDQLRRTGFQSKIISNQPIDDGSGEKSDLVHETQMPLNETGYSSDQNAKEYLSSVIEDRNDSSSVLPAEATNKPPGAAKQQKQQEKASSKDKGKPRAANTSVAEAGSKQRKVSPKEKVVSLSTPERGSKVNKGMAPTNAETEFLMRHADSMRLEQDKRKLEQETATQAMEIAELRNTNSSYIQELDNLKQKLVQLSTGTESKAQIIERMKQDLSTSREELAKSQRDFLAAMKEKEEEVERLSLEVEQARHQALANMAQHDNEKSLAAKLSDGQQLRSEMQRTIHDLNEQIVELSGEIRRLKSQSDEAVKDATKQSQKKFNEKVTGFQDQLDKLSSENDAKQVVIRDLQHSFELSKTREQELKRQISQLSSEKVQLQEELGIASQSLKSLSSIGTSEDAAINAVRAAAEAKVARMKNELNYVENQVKSQLENINTLKDNLSKQQETMSNLLQQHKAEIGKMETSHKADMREREQAFEKELEIPRSQISLLEEKVGSLQHTLAKMHTEMDVTKRKLALSEQDQRRAKQNASRLEQEKEELERNLAELQSSLSSGAAHGEDSVGMNESHQHDIIVLQTDLKNMENQVNYLQKQLHVETRLKTELEESISQTQAQLRKCTNDWREDAQAKELEKRLLEKGFQETEAALRQQHLESQGQVSNLLAQVEELKAAYAKAKDQLKLDQDILSDSQQRIEDLRGELERARKLAASLDDESVKTTDSYRKTIATLERRLQDSESQSAKEISLLKSKLSDAHAHVSETNRSMIMLKDSAAVTEMRERRKQAVQSISKVFESKKYASKARAFERIRGYSSAEAALERMADELGEISQQHRRDMAAQVHQVKVRAEQEAAIHLEGELSKQRTSNEKRLAEIESMAFEDNLATVIRESKRFKDQMNDVLKQQQAIHDANLKTVLHEGDIKLKKLQAALSAEKQTILKRAEHEKISALESATSELESKYQQEIREIKECHDAELQTMKSQRDEEYHLLKNALLEDKEKALRGLIDTSKEDHLAAVTVLEREKEVSLRKLREELMVKHEEGLATALREAEENYKIRIDRLSESHSIELKERLDTVQRRHESEMEELRINLESKGKKNTEDIERQMESKLEQVRESFEQKLKDANLKAEKLLEKRIEEARQEERDEKAKSLKLSTEKWQKILEECTNDAIKEQERQAKVAMQERAALENQLKSKFEEDLSERDRAAVRAQNAMAERLREESKNAMKREREKLEEKFNETIRQKLEDARNKEETSLIRAEGEKQRLLQVSKTSAKEELDRALENAENEKLLALEACTREAASQLATQLKRARAEEREKFEAVLSQMAKEREESEKQILEECNVVTEKKLTEAKQFLEEAVARTRQEVETRLGREIRRLQEELDQGALVSEKRQQALLDEQSTLKMMVDEKKEMLEEAEDMNFDLQRRIDRLEKMGVALEMRRRLEKAKAISAFAKFRKLANEELKRQIDTSQKAMQGNVEKVQKQIQRSDEKLQSYESMSKGIREILTNYKRNELMQTKVETAVLQDELSKLHAAKRETEKQRGDLNRELAHLEGQVREVEVQIQEMSKVSAIQDGKINVTHAKKKRQLDQTFEHLLDRATQRKELLDSVSNKIANLEEQAQMKESKLKELESGLVQILVEQQKQLLRAITTTGFSSKV